MVEEPLSQRITKVIGRRFSSAIKRFGSDIPRAHDWRGFFQCRIITGRIGSAAGHATFPAIGLKTGRHAVDLALKYDVLAVCAVFVFVGAILLGAF